MDKEVIVKDGVWMTKEEHDKIKEWYDKLWTGLIWGFPEREPLTPEQIYLNTLKWAWVVTEKGRVMTMVSNLDNKAYKMDGYDTIMPLQEMEYLTFERWCTTFDL